MVEMPEGWVYGFLRRFHEAATGVPSPTAEVGSELAQIDLTNLARWTRGVDFEVFAPGPAESPHAKGTASSRFLFVGDVAGGTDAAALDQDPRKAALRALRIGRDRFLGYAERFSWAAATLQFLAPQPQGCAPARRDDAPRLMAPAG